MNFQDMFYFTQVAQHHSYSVAARQLFVSQPALSRSVKLLEEELNVCLFYRSKNGMELTNEGELVLRHVSDILDTHQKIQEYFSYASRQTPPVVLVMTTTINPVFGAMAELAQLPQLRLEQIAAHRDYLSNHPWDLVLFSEDAPSERVEAQVLKQETFCFAVDRHHPLAECEALTTQQIMEYPLILPSQQNEVGNLLHAMFQKKQLTPSIAIESDDYFSYSQFLSQGIVGIIPSFSSGLQEDGSLCMIPWLDCRRERKLYLAQNPVKELSPYALYVKKHIIQYFKTV